MSKTSQTKETAANAAATSLTTPKKPINTSTTHNTVVRRLRTLAGQPPLAGRGHTARMANVAGAAAGPAVDNRPLASQLRPKVPINTGTPKELTAPKPATKAKTILVPSPTNQGDQSVMRPLVAVAAPKLVSPDIAPLLRAAMAKDAKFDSIFRHLWPSSRPPVLSRLRHTAAHVAVTSSTPRHGPEIRPSVPTKVAVRPGLADVLLETRLRAGQTKVLPDVL